MSRMFALLPLLLLLSACSSVAVIENQRLDDGPSADSYSLKAYAGSRGSPDIAMMVAFSGGGTRAAALAYGVLQQMRDTTALIDGKQHRILDQIDTISSVSGGSFTAAYFGLYGDAIFDDFEQVFLRRDVQGVLVRSLFNPLSWLSATGRTENAVKYYDREMFHGATFADLGRSDGPLIMINASDLAKGVRFSFVQEFFGLLCSDIASFPVARAVAASSAVPLLFNPVVLGNYPDCKQSKPVWLLAAEQRGDDDPQLALVAEGLNSYFDADRHYVHLVDGGITDNLGLRGMYNIIEVLGGLPAFMNILQHQPPRHLVMVSVNASTDSGQGIDDSASPPSLEQTINAVTDVQLHQYNAATLKLMREELQDWADQLSTPARPVKAHFIELGFRGIAQPDRRAFFNRVPTSFSLSDEQVDKVIAAGRELLRDSREFKQFLADLGGGS